MKNLIILMLTFILFFQNSYSQINDANTLYEQLTSQSIDAQNQEFINNDKEEKKYLSFWREENKFKSITH